MEQEIYLALILLFAQTVKTITGFGSGIITVTLAGIFLPLTFVVPVIICLNCIMNAYITIRHRDKICVDEWGYKIAPFTLLGLLIGLFLFYSWKNTLLKAFLGTFVVILSIWQVYITKAKIAFKPLSRVQTYPILVSAGVFNALYSAGGPLIVYYLTRKIQDKSVFRSTVASSLLLLNVVVIASYAMSGILSWKLVAIVGSYLPILLLGILIGEWAHKKIDDEKFRLMIFILLIFAGSSLLLSSLT